MQPHAHALLIAALTSAALAIPTHAQSPAADSSAGAPEAPARPVSGRDQEWSLSFAPRAEYTFSGDLRSSDSRVSVARTGVEFNASGPLGDRARLLLNADLEASFYRFKDTALPLPSAAEPIRDAYTLRIRPGVSYKLDDEWSLLGGAIVEFAGESGAEVGKSVTFGGYGGAAYRVNENLSLTFGLIVKTRLEDDAFVAPLLGVRWKIDEKLSLATEGLGVRLTAKVSEQFNVSMFARYEMRDFRLDDDAIIPSGIVQDTRLPVGATLEWSPSTRFNLALSGGVIAFQKFTFLNENGDELAGDKTRVAPFIGLRGELKF